MPATGLASAGAEAAILLPTYNEAATLASLIRGIYHELPAATVIVIDDGSPDGTGDIASGLQASYPTLRLIRRTQRDGLASAYVAGYVQALREGCRYVIQMDADGSHDSAHLPEFLTLAGEHDLVIGSRYLPGGTRTHCPWSRRLLSDIGRWYVRLWLHLPVSDVTSGFRLLSRRLLEELVSRELRSRGYSVQIETAWLASRRSLKVTELPIEFRPRTHGRSKLSMGVILEALWRVPRLKYSASQPAQASR